MTQTVDEFARNLARSGLMSEEELGRFREGLPPAKQADPQAVAFELVNAGKLTKYQAAAVFQGKIQALVLGKYVVLDKIGAGGMGQVFKALDRRMERVVALKLLPGSAFASPDGEGPQLEPAAPKAGRQPLSREEKIERLLREARTAARLQHANIVTVYDVDEANGIYFLAMEYVAGRDLTAVLKTGHPLPVADAVGYVVQAARGLDYAHHRGVVHRDVKPQNLMLDDRGTIKVLDMGLARLADKTEEDADTDQGGPTHSGQVVGTVDFMSPEQADDTQQADHRSDIYSLGCTLYVLLTGKPPFTGETLIRKFLAHREHPIPSLLGLRSDVPAALDAAYQRMVAKRPEDRPQSMAEVISQLEACLATPPPAPPPPVETVASEIVFEPAPAEKGTVGPVRPPLPSPPPPALPQAPSPPPKSKRKLPPLPVPPARPATAPPVAPPLPTSAGVPPPPIANRPPPVPPRASKSAGEVFSTPQLSPPPPPPMLPSGSPKSGPKTGRTPVSGGMLPRELINSIGMKLVLIPAGQFRMGSPEGEKKRNDDEFQHLVRISRPYYLGVYPVTQAEYAKVMGKNPSYFAATAGGRERVKGIDTARFPVERVSWSDAVEFCKKLSAAEGKMYRLPTEGEWEYACRAGTQTVFHFGDTLLETQANCICSFPYGAPERGMYAGRTTAVGSFAPNASGLFDMHGNVWEWCQHWYSADSHRDGVLEDPPPSVFEGTVRAARGGSWRLQAAHCRAAFRNGFVPSTRESSIGFRVVCEPR